MPPIHCSKWEGFLEASRDSTYSTHTQTPESADLSDLGRFAGTLWINLVVLFVIQFAEKLKRCQLVMSADSLQSQLEVVVGMISKFVGTASDLW